MAEQQQDLLNPDEPTEFITHFTGTVIKSFWSNPLTESQGKADYDGAERYMLYWLVRYDQFLQEIDTLPESETTTISFSIGDKYEPLSSDRTKIRHENDDSDSNPNSKPKIPAGPTVKRKDGVSLYGRMLSLVSGRVDTYETEEGVAVPDDEDGGPLVVDFHGARQALMEQGATDARDATIWQGTQWEFRGLWLPYGGDIKQKRPKILPVIFRGIEGGSAATRMSEEELTAAVGAVLPTESDELVEKVAKLVATSTSHAAFAKNALRLDGVEGAVKDAVMDEHTGPWSVKSGS